MAPHTDMAVDDIRVNNGLCIKGSEGIPVCCRKLILGRETLVPSLQFISASSVHLFNSGFSIGISARARVSKIMVGLITIFKVFQFNFG